MIVLFGTVLIVLFIINHYLVIHKVMDVILLESYIMVTGNLGIVLYKNVNIEFQILAD